GLTPPSVHQGSVTYGVGGAERLMAEAVTSLQEDCMRHGAVLSGLQPATSYTYSVHSGGETVHGHFRSLPDSGPVRFTATGDFGGATAAEVDVVNLMKQQDPDLFITLGDNTYERGTLADIDQNILTQHADFLHSHGVIWALGNHDSPTQQGTPRTPK